MVCIHLYIFVNVNRSKSIFSNLGTKISLDATSFSHLVDTNPKNRSPLFVAYILIIPLFFKKFHVGSKLKNLRPQVKMEEVSFTIS